MGAPHTRAHPHPHPHPAPPRRIVQNLDAVKAADVVVCVTGMDGGLASVVAGMVEVPVIALPTSTGYGTAFAGVAPMLAALNSSAPGVTVVNIDSGAGGVCGCVGGVRVRCAPLPACGPAARLILPCRRPPSSPLTSPPRRLWRGHGGVAHHEECVAHPAGAGQVKECACSEGV